MTLVVKNGGGLPQMEVSVGTPLVEVLVAFGWARSKTHARELIRAGAVRFEVKRGEHEQ